MRTHSEVFAPSHRVTVAREVTLSPGSLRARVMVPFSPLATHVEGGRGNSCSVLAQYLRLGLVCTGAPLGCWERRRFE
jgi:hypothetical protein